MMLLCPAACALFELKYERPPALEDASELLRTCTTAAAQSGISEAAAGAALDLDLLSDDT